MSKMVKVKLSSKKRKAKITVIDDKGEKRKLTYDLKCDRVDAGEVAKAFTLVSLIDKK